VSVLSFGFWATYGVKDGLTNEEGITMAKECMSLARQKGINLFDNAETYGNPAGATEEIMGEAMAGLDGFLAIEKYLLKKREIFA